MDVIPQASLFIGIIPALIILYFGIKGYEDHYKDKNIFLSFVVGIIIGFIAAVVRIFINAPPLIISFVVIYPIFEQLFKTMALNIGRLHEKSETVVYGLSMGLGFGSVFTPFLIIASSTGSESSVINVILIAMGSFGIIFFHGATGALIGYGIYEGKLARYLLYSILIQIPFNFILDGTRLYSNDFFILLQFSLVIFGGIVFAIVNIKIMPKILNRSQRRMRTKKIKENTKF